MKLKKITKLAQFTVFEEETSTSSITSHGFFKVDLPIQVLKDGVEAFL